MKLLLRLIASLTVMLMISDAFPVFAANADSLPEAAASQDTALLSVSTASEEWETVTSGDPCPPSGGIPEQNPSGSGSEESGPAVSDEEPLFSADIEYSGQGYVVKGTFTEFLPDTSLVRPLYSLDGEVWQTCRTIWNLQWLGSEDADELKALRNQICLYSTCEPLNDYLAGQLDRFYLKLQITLENGVTYETQTAAIDRGCTQPLPESLNPVARFVPAMRIRQRRPFKTYGQYQITVSAESTPEDIAALLPDTLPIEIQLYAGIDFVTNAIVDCPVTWKPLSLSRLAPGESVSIADAAEEIIIPAGTLLNTPNGVFLLNQPLSIDDDNDNEHDEIRLVLNVVAENEAPTGVLTGDFNGLHIAFLLKPTGAAAIRAYTLSEGGTDWVELPNPLLPEEINAPSSAADSTYTTILENTSEPYQSYLSAWNAGEKPVPFLIGLKIEGGVYDGQQLILAWPATYELPTRLPDLNGSGGNECNAGSDNRNDSTPEGQRPGLPQNPEDRPDVQGPEPPHNPNGEQDTQESELPSAPYIPEPKPEKTSDSSQASEEQQTELRQIPRREPKDRQMIHLRSHENETDGSAAGQNDTSIQVSIAEKMPVLIAGTEKPASVLTLSTENGSPTQENTEYKSEYRFGRLCLPAAAAITIGVCIAAAVSKIMAGRISGKIIRTLHRLLHLK